MRTDWSQYVGLEWKEDGPDHFRCWDLVRLVLRQEFGIELPSYDEEYATSQDKDAIARLLRREPTLRGKEIPLADARAGDVIVLRIEGQPWHMGLVVEPPRFLHIEKGLNACIDRWDSMRWQRRIVGVFRHEALCGHPAPVGVTT